MGIVEDFLNAIGGEGNAAKTAAALGLGTAGLTFAEKGYSELGDIGERAFEGLAGEEGLAQELSGMLEFQPYTVTSATGGRFGMTQDPETGQMTYQMGLSPQEQAMQQTLFGGAGQLATQAAAPYDPMYEQLAQQAYGGAGQLATQAVAPYDPVYEQLAQQAYGGVGDLMSQAQQAAMDAGAMDRAAREEQVYGQLRALQSPEEERQRLALEQRMAAQGRTGVRTAQFGGTPEQLAMAKAQSEAQNQASLMAMQQSGAEQQQALQRAAGLQGLTSGMFGMGTQARMTPRQIQSADLQNMASMFGMGTQARMTPRQLQSADLQNMSGMMAAGYVPQAQLIGALQPGMTAAERERQARSEQAGAYGQTYASGLQALLQSGLGQANIAGGFGSNLATAALGGLFS